VGHKVMMANCNDLVSADLVSLLGVIQNLLLTQVHTMSVYSLLMSYVAFWSVEVNNALVIHWK